MPCWRAPGGHTRAFGRIWVALRATTVLIGFTHCMQCRMSATGAMQAASRLPTTSASAKAVPFRAAAHVGRAGPSRRVEDDSRERRRSRAASCRPPAPCRHCRLPPLSCAAILCLCITHVAPRVAPLQVAAPAAAVASAAQPLPQRRCWHPQPPSRRRVHGSRRCQQAAGPHL